MSISGRVPLLLLLGVVPVVLRPSNGTVWLWVLAVALLVGLDLLLAPSPAALAVERAEVGSVRLGHPTETRLTITNRGSRRARGLLLDSARHFMPLEAIKRQIDGMAAAKLNVFHWHLTDDHGWRFASTRYPKLQQKASDGLFYTQAQLDEAAKTRDELAIAVVYSLEKRLRATKVE